MNETVSKKNKPKVEIVLCRNLAKSSMDRTPAGLKALYHCGEKIKSSENLACNQLGR
jgi:hypothetical protein